jgi:hypothetical protein
MLSVAMVDEEHVFLFQLRSHMTSHKFVGMTADHENSPGFQLIRGVAFVCTMTSFLL